MPNTFRIQRSQIIGTRTWVFDVYEAYAGHSTFTYFDGKPWGQVGTRQLTSYLDSLEPFSDFRMGAVQAFHRMQYEIAYTAIVAEFPEAAGGNRSMGHIAVNAPTDDHYPRQTERLVEVA
jgi:hypothetical protein